MAGDSDIPFKEGYLWIPPNGQLKKKAWVKKFCQLFCASKRGVDRLEIYDSEEDSTKTLSVPIVTLEDCIKITQDPQKTQSHVFTVVTKTKIHYFAGSSDSDMQDWITAFQSVAFQDTASRQTIEEDNDLYCSSGGDGVYKVTLIPTDASNRCKLIPGEYTLIVSNAALQLRQTADNHLLYTWPYRYIRRYGQKKRRFTFEAGRKCESGEGTFDLDYQSPQDIFRMMSSRMQSMKQLLSSRDNLLGDSQFHHALGMNARSRSPLPPSPTSTTPIPLPPRKPQRKHPPPPKNKEPEVKVEPRKLSLPTEHVERLGKVFVSEKSSNNYDKLNHFGSTPKINLDPSYSHINLNGNNDWSSSRIVDDRGGYGMIRKKTSDHTLTNGTEYATVCKPHRV